MARIGGAGRQEGGRRVGVCCQSGAEGHVQLFLSICAGILSPVVILQEGGREGERGGEGGRERGREGGEGGRRGEGGNEGEREGEKEGGRRQITLSERGGLRVLAL